VQDATPNSQLPFVAMPDFYGFVPTPAGVEASPMLVKPHGVGILGRPRGIVTPGCSAHRRDHDRTIKREPSSPAPNCSSSSATRR
jgi:hypothetical protein